MIISSVRNVEDTDSSKQIAIRLPVWQSMFFKVWFYSWSLLKLYEEETQSRSKGCRPGADRERQIYRYTSLKSCSKCRSCRHCSSFRWCLHQNCSKAFSVSSSWARSLKHAGTGTSLQTHWELLQDYMAIIYTKIHCIIYKKGFDNCYLSTVVWFSISSGLGLWFSDLAACSLMQPNRVVPCFKPSFSSSWFRDIEAMEIMLISSVKQLTNVCVQGPTYTYYWNIQSVSTIFVYWPFAVTPGICNSLGRTGRLVNKGSNTGYSWGAAITCKIRVSWQMVTAKGIHRLLLSRLANEAYVTHVILLPQLKHTNSNTGDATRCHSLWIEPWKTRRCHPLLLKIQKSREIAFDSTLCKPGDKQLAANCVYCDPHRKWKSSFLLKFKYVEVVKTKWRKLFSSHQRLSNCQWYNFISYWDLNKKNVPVRGQQAKITAPLECLYVHSTLNTATSLRLATLSLHVSIGHKKEITSWSGSCML